MFEIKTRTLPGSSFYKLVQFPFKVPRLYLTTLKNRKKCILFYTFSVPMYLLTSNCMSLILV